MGCHLERIEDQEWDDLIIAAGYGVTRLARTVGSSRQHLNRHFRRHFGLPVHAWIARRRMQRAQALLESRMPIKQVASELGYAHASDFAYAFRLQYGSRPSESRRPKRRSL
jgi:AraC family transcriptional regulator